MGKPDPFASSSSSPPVVQIQRTVVCVRCHEPKYLPSPVVPVDLKTGRRTGPPIPVVEPYTCVRCRAVLAGRNAVDPVSAKPPMTPERQAALQAARKSAREGRFQKTGATNAHA